MADKEHLDKLKLGVPLWNQWRKDNPEVKPDLSGIDFLDDSELIASIANYTGKKHGILNINLSNVDLTGSKFNNIFVHGGLFAGANLTEFEVYDCHFKNVIFSVRTSTAREALAGNIKNQVTDNSVLEKLCILKNASFYSTTFEICSFSLCDLTSVKLDESTRFVSLGVVGTKISRSQLDSLDDYGGLTPRRLSEMLIDDDTALLRESFSGFWNILHLAALFVFLLPYAWFLLSQWQIAKIGDLLNYTGETSPILVNLLRFIVSGGESWREWLPSIFVVFLFIFTLVFNVIRFVLFMKTKYIENLNSIQGFRGEFKIRGVWSVLYKSYKLMSILALMAVALNTIIFLMHPVPL